MAAWCTASSATPSGVMTNNYPQQGTFRMKWSGYVHSRSISFTVRPKRGIDAVRRTEGRLCPRRSQVWLPSMSPSRPSLSAVFVPVAAVLGCFLCPRRGRIWPPIFWLRLFSSSKSFFSSKNIVWWRFKKFLAKNLDISNIRLIFAALMSKRWNMLYVRNEY